MEYWFQATSNNIHRTQEYVIISDGLVAGTVVAGTVTTVGSLKQFQLIKNISFVQPAWNMGLKLLLTTFIVHKDM